MEYGTFTYTSFFKKASSQKYLLKNQLTAGNTPVYSATTENCGIESYCGNEPEFIVDEQHPFYIVFGDHTHAINIATESFCIMNTAKVLVPVDNHITELIARYICTAWEKVIPDLGYSRHWSKAETAEIQLPVTDSGEPDWQYMEDYMKGIMEEVEHVLDELNTDLTSPEPLSANFGTFRLGDYFICKRSKAIKLKEIEDGETPIVTMQSDNEGVNAYKAIEPTYENKITISLNGGGTGLSFYHPYKFAIANDAGVIIEKQELSDLTKFYLATLFTSYFPKHFNWSNKLTPTYFEDTMLELPIDSQSNPDWAYMEQYMQQIMTDIQNEYTTIKEYKNVQ